MDEARVLTARMATIQVRSSLLLLSGSPCLSVPSKLAFDGLLCPLEVYHRPLGLPYPLCLWIFLPQTLERRAGCKHKEWREGQGGTGCQDSRPEFEMHVLQVAIQDLKVLALAGEDLASSSML